MTAALDRPDVTVVLPFYGSAAEADRALVELSRLALREGDAVVVADNTGEGVATRRPHAPAVEVMRCPVTCSAYAARNVATERADTEWVLFVDADCRLPHDLLDRYFDPPPGPDTGALAGQVAGTPGQPGLIPDYIRSRGHLDQALLLRHPYRPMAVTANLLVRRTAWEDLGGFAERTRSGADSDFCWRLQDAGWRIELREHARVSHDHRASLRALLAQARRDGAGGTWAARRHPGYSGMIRARGFVRAAAGAVGWPLLAQPRRGLYKAIDGIWGLATDVGALQGNAPPEPDTPPANVIALLERFPVPGDALLAAIADAANRGAQVRVEARCRPLRCDWRTGRRVRAALWEDDGIAARLWAAATVLRRRADRSCQRADRELVVLAPSAKRLARDAPRARILAEPALVPAARELVRLAARPDMVVEEVRDGVDVERLLVP